MCCLFPPYRVIDFKYDFGSLLRFKAYNPASIKRTPHPTPAPSTSLGTDLGNREIRQQGSFKGSSSEKWPRKFIVPERRANQSWRHFSPWTFISPLFTIRWPPLRTFRPTHLPHRSFRGSRWYPNLPNLSSPITVRRCRRFGWSPLLTILSVWNATRTPLFGCFPTIHTRLDGRGKFHAPSPT